MDPVAEFRVIALVAPQLDARIGGSRRPARHVMADAELAEMLRVLGTVPGSVDAWSEGRAAFRDYDVRVVDTPVRQLSPTGPDRYWVGPADIADIISRHVARGRWDSVLFVYPTDGSYPACGWGCTIGPSGAANGAGFSSITSDRWAADRTRLHPNEGFVHEWLHQVEAIYRRYGLSLFELPDLHDVADRTSARSPDLTPFGRGYVEHERATGTWQPWYRDLMTGTVGPKGAERSPVGLTTERWARRPAPRI